MSHKCCVRTAILPQAIQFTLHGSSQTHRRAHGRRRRPWTERGHPGGRENGLQRGPRGSGYRGQLRRPHSRRADAPADPERRHRHPPPRRHHPRHHQSRQPVRVSGRNEGRQSRLLGRAWSRISASTASTRSSSSGETARSASPIASSSKAFRSSACRRPSTTTSWARSARSASTRPSISRPRRSIGFTARRRRITASWWSR